MTERVIRDLGREKGRPVPEGGRIWTPLSGWEDRSIHSSSPSHSAPPDLSQDEWVVRRKRGAKGQTSGNTPGKGHRTDFSSGTLQTVPTLYANRAHIYANTHKSSTSCQRQTGKF